MADLPMLGDRVACPWTGAEMLVVDVANPWPQRETEYRCRAAGGEIVTLVAADFLPGGPREAHPRRA